MASSTEMKGFIREHCEQRYAKTLANLDKMEGFLETQSPPSLNHEETEHLNRPMTNKEVKLEIKTSQQRKSLDLMLPW